jgi:hypothetical protein
VFGAIIFRLEGILAPIAFVTTCIVFFGCEFLMLRFEHRLQDKAEHVLRGLA